MARRRTVDEHAGRIAALVGPTLARHETETVPLAVALGRVTSEPIVTAGPLPPFRNAQMDGYAARAADIRRTPVVLPVDGVLPAAAATATSLAPGHLLKVMTGAPVPEGADCVVPVEQTVEEDGGVRIVRPVEAGCVRARGGQRRPARHRRRARPHAPRAPAHRRGGRGGRRRGRRPPPPPRRRDRDRRRGRAARHAARARPGARRERRDARRAGGGGGRRRRCSST